MEYITTTLGNLVHQTAFFSLTWGNVIMIAVACFFLYLAIRHGFEPLLLVPIAFGMLLVNIYPDIMLHAEDAANGTGGLLYYFYLLDEWSILPSLIFLDSELREECDEHSLQFGSHLAKAFVRTGIVLRAWHHAAMVEPDTDKKSCQSVEDERPRVDY